MWNRKVELICMSSIVSRGDLAKQRWKFGAVVTVSITWSVAPWLVIRRKHAQMTATYKLAVIHRKKGANGGQKFRVENNLQQQKLTEI